MSLRKWKEIQTLSRKRDGLDNPNIKMGKLKKIITSWILVTSIIAVSANSSDTVQVSNNIIFFKDPRVDILQKIYLRKADGKKKGLIRVQVFQAPSRERIFEAKAQFSARFPGIATFVTYVPPNFKLRAGEFETQQEAYKFMQQVKPYFPASFVIEEKASSPGDDKKPKQKNY